MASFKEEFRVEGRLAAMEKAAILEFKRILKRTSGDPVVLYNSLIDEMEGAENPEDRVYKAFILVKLTEHLDEKYKETKDSGDANEKIRVLIDRMVKEAGENFAYHILTYRDALSRSHYEIIKSVATWDQKVTYH